ncbi:MAG: hypothetical protein KGN84_06620 [Acidobacteriota bacterium]|nr:hypothetical protein [Acidobacteriota bacterium]
MSGSFSLERAGRWFLTSGIQNASGGVARFYLADSEKNRPVSTEITGYAASALMYLYAATGEDRYLDRARLTANFLCEHAWDRTLRMFPYEHPSPTGESDHLGYFFDSGIIVRGLLAVWRVTREPRLLDVANEAARTMLDAFRAEDGYHPILRLPEKAPLARTGQWSRSPGCYQAKSAMCWWDVAEITGDEAMRSAYLDLMNEALRTHEAFLPGEIARARVMDRLHAYSYFLEALMPLLNRAACAAVCAAGIGRVAGLLREIAPEFARSDVYAQLLRARVYASGVIPMDADAAREEAARLAEFQVVSDDARVDGSFWFGRRGGKIVPHANPVSAAFALQALSVWDAWRDRRIGFDARSII